MGGKVTQFQGDSIFWVEVNRIVPNPYQPRREFDQEQLQALADSVRQYGVLQPLTVTRREHYDETGNMRVEYELIAGERRLRASKIAGLVQVPVIIRSGEEDPLLKLELAIIENVQREDLNAIDRAIAFKQLADEFGFKHSQIAKKVGKSREYVSNSIRLLNLPEEAQQAIRVGQINEGLGRPLLMLKDRPEEQKTLFKEMLYKNMTTREAEKIARSIAKDRVRKPNRFRTDPEINELEDKLSEALGTRVQIEKKDKGGKIHIDFFSPDDVRHIIRLFETASATSELDAPNLLERFLAQAEKKAEAESTQATAPVHENQVAPEEVVPTSRVVSGMEPAPVAESVMTSSQVPTQSSATPAQGVTDFSQEPVATPIEEKGAEETVAPTEAESSSVPLEPLSEEAPKPEDRGDDDLYSFKNFTV